MSGTTINLNSLVRHLGDWRAAGAVDVGYRSLAFALKGLVLDGRLPLHARLPSERRLAEALGVSRITVSAALDRLRADGFAVSRVGSGTYTTLPGRGLDGYPGVADAMAELRSVGAEVSGDGAVELYVLSSGFVDMIAVSPVAKLFDGVWRSSLHWSEMVSCSASSAR